jgi:hypothetical protein
MAALNPADFWLMKIEASVSKGAPVPDAYQGIVKGIAYAKASSFEAAKHLVAEFCAFNKIQILRFTAYQSAANVPAHEILNAIETTEANGGVFVEFPQPGINPSKN